MFDSSSSDDEEEEGIDAGRDAVVCFADFWHFVVQCPLNSNLGQGTLLILDCSYIHVHAVVSANTGVFVCNLIIHCMYILNS